MQTTIRKLRKKIPVKLLEKVSIRIEKDGSKTETFEKLSTPKNK